MEGFRDRKGYNEESGNISDEQCEIRDKICYMNDNLSVKKDEMLNLKQSDVCINDSLGEAAEDFARSNPVALQPSKLHTVGSDSILVDACSPNLRKIVPRLKIAMLAVGTRGDVQPFLAVAKKLQEYGHHVRLATHINFSDFVKSEGVEFYPLGGDPRVLAGYMARNKGLPLAPGELILQRKQLKAIMESILPACTDPDIKTGETFRAQAIIANPPAYGQTHVAEALNIPVHILFTLPWTPTLEFPHPIAHLPQSPGNRLSYILVDLLIWWLIRDQINDVRKTMLKLPPISYFSTYIGSIYHLPTTYMWSRHVLPKPKDWGPDIDVVGYCFLNLGSNYQPRQDFVEWIKMGPNPVYVGFGSMLLVDSRKTTEIILEALKQTGQRGILDRGWGDLGIYSELPDDVFLVENCPHDWLFPQCSAVVHHGGGGTTAAGLKAGCPTAIIPFSGDQFFWGDKVHERGLGPKPIPVHQLTVEALAKAIEFMINPEVKSRAMEIAELIENEDGVASAVDAFHRHLPNELPVPVPPTSSVENDCPNLIQWCFVQIGTFCSLACS